MNFNTTQMKTVRAFISKEDREYIAQQTQKSIRTVEAVLNCDRTNDDIEQAIFRVAKMNLAKLSRTLLTVEAQNLLPTTVDQYLAVKAGASWSNNEIYQRYNDIYLRLCYATYNEIDEVWSLIKMEYRDIIPFSAYCCDLLIRLTGINENAAIKFYNNSISDF
jgi:hypothetical protein